jgi:3-oxoacyl-[acyl-carrier-protein] synthase-1
MASGDANIVGLGARTPVGLHLAAASAAIRGGIAAFTEHEFLVDTAGAPIVVARDALLAADVQLMDRIDAMVRSATREAVTALASCAETERSGRKLHVLLALPTARPDVQPELEGRTAAAVAAELRDIGTVGSITTLSQGHGGALLAVADGVRRLAQKTDDLFLIVGADSYLNADALEWLEQQQQLHQEGNPWGIIPGEAAGAVLLASSATAQALRLCTWGDVRAIGVATEQNLIKTDQVCLGHGLTQAIQDAVAGLPEGERIDRTICDMNGEPYRTDEYGYARVRTSQSFVDPSNFITPVDCWGDVGAASGVLFVGLACMAAARQIDYGRYVLVWTSSENGLRTAALLEVQSSERNRL